jgi:hypothetical protein
MAIPSHAQIEVPLLKVLYEAGGELANRDAIRLVTLAFPELTKDELAERRSSGMEISGQIA